MGVENYKGIRHELKETISWGNKILAEDPSLEGFVRYQIVNAEKKLESYSGVVGSIKAALVDRTIRQSIKEKHEEDLIPKDYRL